MSEYIDRRRVTDPPRLPLEGNIDLTNRCNNDCLHCYLRIAPDAEEGREELSLDEIKRIVDEARAMGCRSWGISGGEPMLRPDFSEIFDYISRMSASCILNTNGTLITPEIARLMKRQGVNMLGIYGATAEVHDHITRNPGSFEAVMQGIAYLKEAGAGFTVQITPMKDNLHQLDDMIKLAESLTPRHRYGASWIYLSTSGDQKKNREIRAQRLDPRDAVRLNRPDFVSDLITREGGDTCGYLATKSDRILEPCITIRRDFHIDPYGGMSFCMYAADPALRYDLRRGSLREAWEVFIPSLIDKVRGGKEYQENCGSCELRSDCKWCPIWGYIEHQRYSARVEYLCAIAGETRRVKEQFRSSHLRCYQIGGITVLVESDLPITDNTFHPKLKTFEVDGPGEDVVVINHHFALPDTKRQDLGQEIYRRAPWAIYRKGDSWIYSGVSSSWSDEQRYKLAVFNHNHTRGRIYNKSEDDYRRGNLHSLTTFTSDQILLARVLADRQGCILHAAGVILDGSGVLFVGHSDAGKSTITAMLKDNDTAEIQCDDRMIVRRQPDGWRSYGTWSHGELPDVSSASAPLKALMFLEKDTENRIVRIEDRREIISRVLACLIKPLMTEEWWEKVLKVVGGIVRDVPCYRLHFDKSGKVVDLLHRI